MPIGVDVSEAVQQQMLAAYAAGATSKQAASRFGLSAGACKLALRRAGGLARNKSDAQRVYGLDESFFEFINSEEKAYWLGFFSADGCVYGHRLTVTLSSADRDHLSLYKGALKWTGPIYEIPAGKKGGPLSSVSFASKPLTTQLSALGIRPNKTFSLSPWIGANDHRFARDYWRGFIDGDGCLCRCAGTRNISLIGTKDVIEAFSRFVELRTGSRAKMRRRGCVYVLALGGRLMATKLASVLYSGATLALRRKLEIAAQWVLDPSDSIQPV